MKIGWETGNDFSNLVFFTKDRRMLQGAAYLILIDKTMRDEALRLFPYEFFLQPGNIAVVLW